jgi:hypothetical protein
MSEHKVLYYVNFQKPHLMNQQVTPRDTRWMNVIQAALLGSAVIAGAWLMFAVIWL